MKIFNVIAILCSLFIVVNGQTNQQYTYEFILTGIDPDFTDIKVHLGSNSLSMDCEILSQTPFNQECTASITSETSYNDYYYYYSYKLYGFQNWEFLGFGNHPCIFSIADDRDITYRWLQNDVYEYTDILLARPPCMKDEVQCDEFVYDDEILHFRGQQIINCRSIPVDKISTLKTALAESSSFNGNCEMST